MKRIRIAILAALPVALSVISAGSAFAGGAPGPWPR